MTHPGHTMMTARLTLRPVTDRDAPAIAAAINDHEVLRWLSRAPCPYGLADAQTFIDKNRDNAGAVWMIEDSQGLVGCIGRKREFGYWVTRSAWGKGYATEASRAVLARHFADPDAPGLLSGYHEGNVRSARVLAKPGFRPCADRRVFAKAVNRAVTIKGMWLDATGYAAAKDNSHDQ